MGRRLQEQFGAVGGIDFVVMRGRTFGFLHPGHLAALVGHAGGPDLLVVDRGQATVATRGNLDRLGPEQPGDGRGRVGAVQEVGK